MENQCVVTRCFSNLSTKAPQNTERSKRPGVWGTTGTISVAPAPGADSKSGISSKFYVSSLTSDINNCCIRLHDALSKIMVRLQIIYENWCFRNMGHIHFVASWVVSGLNTPSCVQRLPRLLVERHWCRNARQCVHMGDPRSHRMNMGLGVNKPGFLF